MNLMDLTLEELEKEQQRINAERAALKEQAVAVQAVMDKKTAEEAAKKTYGRMSGAEKAALHQLVQDAGNVASEEAVGTPT